MRKKAKCPMDIKCGKSKVMEMKEALCAKDDLYDLNDIETKMDNIIPGCIMMAHSYVPQQTYEKAFTPPEALMKGTLFPELWGVYKIPK